MSSKTVFQYRTATSAEIDKRIASIKGRAETLREDIQEVALATLVQLQHRNLNHLNQLWLAMGAGARREAMAVWLSQHVDGLKVNRSQKERAVRPFTLDAEVVVRLDDAAAQPWYLAKKENSLERMFDADKAVQNLLKRLQQASKAGKLDGKGVRTLHALQSVLSDSSASEVA